MRLRPIVFFFVAVAADPTSMCGASTLPDSARVGVGSVVAGTGRDGSLTARSPLSRPAHSFLSAEGTARPAGERLRLASARLVARLPLPETRGLATTVELGALYDEPARAGERVRSEGRLLLSSGDRGAWFGFAAQGADAAESGWAPLFAVGGWSRMRRLTIGGAMGQARDLVRRDWMDQVDSLFVPRSGLVEVTLTTASASVRWAHELLELEATAGMSLGPSIAPRHWSQGRATFWPWRPVGIVLQAGSRAPILFGAADPTTRASLGLAIDPWRGMTTSSPTEGVRSEVTCSWRHASRGVYALEVHAPEAMSVEVMGDVTDWMPIRLERGRSGVFRVHLRVAPGIHHLSLRIDAGEWSAPPGAPLAADDFGTPAGVFVAR
jgi:hypothetical protein